MEHRIRILHISDMHERGLRDSEAWRREAVLGTSWLENLRAISSDGAIDLVCFTGDITQSGRQDEYGAAERFTDATLAALSLDRSRLFLVPGNHDVDRTRDPEVWRHTRARLLEMSDLERSRFVLSGDAQINTVLRRQHPFWAWIDGLGLRDLLPENSPHRYLGFRKTLRLPGKPFDLHVIGLNSAWLSGDGNDAGKLELTEDQVIRLTSDDGRPLAGLRVALMHHPLSELRDMSQARRDLSKNVDLLLRGHLHEGETMDVVQPGLSLREIAAGCLYDGHHANHWPNSCNVLTLMVNRAGVPVSCEVQIRGWSRRGFWFDDNSMYKGTVDGRVRWALSSKPSIPYDERANLFAKLEDANARRATLATSGLRTDEVDNEVLALRREIRGVGRPRPGATMGARYLLEKEIGEGGFAIVFSAFDLEQSKRVAVKCMHSHLSRNPIARERFFRGARAQASLSHQRIVPVQFVSLESETVPFFVMPLAERDFEQGVLSGQLDDAKVLKILVEVAEALEVAHASGMVHRDVKPANILLQGDEGLLSDFDLVWNAGTTGGTRTGALGTFVYAAPENLQHPETADKRADVYGFAMTCVFALRRGPIGIDDLANLPSVIEQLECPEELRVGLRDSLEWRREKRCQAVSPVLSALRQALTPSEVDAPEFLLWYRASQKRETVWLRESVDGPTILGRRSGIFLSDGTDVLEWEQAEVPVEFTRATGVPEQLGPPVAGHVTDIRLVNTSNGEIYKPQSWAEEIKDWTGYFSYGRAVGPTCSVGTLLFLRENTWAFGAGAAHPWSGASFRAIDLKEKRELEWLTEEERQEILERGTAYTWARLKEDETYTSLFEDNEARLEALELHFEPTGLLQCGYRFVVFESYAGGDREWGDYSRSVVYPSAALPKRLEQYGTLPSAAMAYLRRFSEWPEALGWTELPTDSEQRKKVLKNFRSKTPTWRAF